MSLTTFRSTLCAWICVWETMIFARAMFPWLRL